MRAHELTTTELENYRTMLGVIDSGPERKALSAALEVYAAVMVFDAGQRRGVELARAQHKQLVTMAGSTFVDRVATKGAKPAAAVSGVIGEIEAASGAVAHAALIEAMMPRAVATAAEGVHAALRAWGRDGSGWLAVQRATSGAHTMPDDDGLTVWAAQRVSVSFRVPDEVLDHPLAQGTTFAVVNRGTVPRLRRTIQGLPGPVGPTAEHHPEVLADARRPSQYKQVLREDMTHYDGVRFARYVAYWSCCAVAAGQAKPVANSAHAWSITAPWADHAALVNRYTHTPVLV